MANYIEHPLLKKNGLESRIYQKVLAANALKKGNTMIVAPTALGKTVIAILVAIDRLVKLKNTKILVLAPSKPLTIQHEESFREFTTVPVTSITGGIKADEREKRWKESTVICATPQTVESDLLKGRYTLEDLSLIVFDECHHAVGSYSYVYLANRYIQERENHLILALTASPGHDKSKIKEVCNNLFIQDIVVKSEDDPDVKPYFNPINIDWVPIELGRELKKIQDFLNKSLKTRLKALKNMGVISSITVSKRDILQAQSRIRNKLATTTNPPKECYQAVSIVTAVINVQHSLELLETQGVSTLNQYIKRLEKKKTKASKNLFLDSNFSRAARLSRIAEDNGHEHPKLKKLIQILNNELGLDDGQTRIQSLRNSPDSESIEAPKILVFTQFRDTLEVIHQKCQEEGIKSVKFYGQGKSGGEKGLTQKQQKEIIKSFKMGNYDVLLSTSVAEEGIDIPAIDLVVLYEPVPSEIRMIQRRGRTGRKHEGKMKVLLTKGTRDEAYFWASKRKESNMKYQLVEGDLFDNLNLNAVERIESVRSIKAVEVEGSDKNSDKDNQDKVTAKSKPSKVSIYADSREGNSNIIRNLDQIGVKVEIREMAVGDYQISNDVIIERKTTKDFRSSIVDKRLFKQATLMREEFKKPIMIIEGNDLYAGFLDSNAIRGAIASIAIDFGISIIPTRNSDDTAAMIKRIAFTEQKGNNTPIQIRTERKPDNLWEQQQFIIESLPNIGPVTAKKLLEKFATVKNVLNASAEELQEVDGIGLKTAENIVKVIDSKYLHFKKDNSNKKLI
ncbi:DEAD/DEAH box helicase [uncultured Methanobrevibacter sp.]|uniref:DEAD/DEAH box helicase n=1 Tax=uncultured Methanobrevibacter sp. TaxID=253161 RepID=UPI0025D976A4|nr:DEAD/DEAH box helicase [uncultured Methanobrevibacter sp.]